MFRLFTEVGIRYVQWLVEQPPLFVNVVESEKTETAKKS